MNWTRREFLRNSALAAAGVGLSSPLFGATKTLRKAPAANEKVVVVLNLFGGNDGINTVIPLSSVEYNAYQALRSTLAFDQSQILTLNATPDFGLNPGLTAFQSLYDQGKLAIISGVGVPQTATGLFDHEAGQYEFQSCDIVRSGTSVPTGWLGRYVDSVPDGQISAAIDLGGGRLIVTGANKQPVSIYTVDDFQLQVSSWGGDEAARRTAYQNIMNAGPITDSPVAEQNRLYRVSALQQSAVLQSAVASYPT
ncbi:MAG TPA: twin-arginine translocation signal domain-containing protein, partial [Acidobacteriota bacterium]|nr:twin-arginine translocation signal domain-containing protein [Acidobacteriota bacterium]